MHVGKLLNVSVEKGLESGIKSSIIINDKGVTQDRCDSFFRYICLEKAASDRSCRLTKYSEGVAGDRFCRLVILRFGCSWISLG